MQFQFKTLENVRKDELVSVINAVFANYFVKIELNETSLADKIALEGIDLSKSAGVFFANRLIGFALTGIDLNRSYNSGTGILPEFRGNGLTVGLYDFILPKLRNNSIDFQTLEVITQNTPAIVVYQKLGFKKVRSLVCFKGRVKISKTNEAVELRLLSNIDESSVITFWNSHPAWQNSLSAVMQKRHLHKMLGAFIEDNFVGYLIHTEDGRVKQFGVKSEYRRIGVGSTLFSRLGEIEITITNIDKKDQASLSYLDSIGLDRHLEQFEMKLDI